MIKKTFVSIRPVYIFLFFLAFYLLTFNTGGYNGHFYSIDGKVEYDQMRAIAGGDLSLLISPHKHLGLSLAEIPFYLIGKGMGRIFCLPLNPLAALLINPFLSALLCLLFFLTVRTLSTQKTALILTFLCGFGTLIWTCSKSDTTDILVVLCAMSVFWALLNYNRTGREKWFFIAAGCMAAAYVTKLSSHGFLLGWMFYVYVSGLKNGKAFRGTAARLLLVFILWCAFIPLSVNVYKAHSTAYTWSWFDRFGYKCLLKEFSFLDGLFWYFPLLFLSVFYARQFAKKYTGEFVFIILLITPYFITLHLGKDVVCVHDFASRYDMVYIPFFLIMLIPVIEGFSRLSLFPRICFFGLSLFGLYVQFLGLSVSPLYYANVMVGSLGAGCVPYAFSWQYSPFGMYPRFIVQAVTALAVPVKGINNVSGSIDGLFTPNYFWAGSGAVIFKIMAVVLAAAAAGFGVYLLRLGRLSSSFKKYFKEIVILIAVFSVVWGIMFVPKEIFTEKKKKPVSIENSGFEVFNDSREEKMPRGWRLLDWSSHDGRPSVTVSPNTDEFFEGNTSMEMVMNQDYVTVSLCSAVFKVKKREIIQAVCYIRADRDMPCTIRISFAGETGAPFYYAPTTRIEKDVRGWRKFSSTVLVPEGASRASFYLNIWGKAEKGDKVLFDGVKIIKALN